MRGRIYFLGPFNSLLLVFFIATSLRAQDVATSYANAGLHWGKDWHAVVGHLEKAKALVKTDQGIYHPDYLTLLNELGIAYFESGDINLAHQTFTELCRLHGRLEKEMDHGYWLAYANLARVEKVLAADSSVNSFKFLLNSPFEDIRISGLNGIYDIHVQHNDYASAEALINDFQPRQSAEKIALDRLRVDLKRNQGNLEQAQHLLIAYDSMIRTIEPGLMQTAKLGSLEQWGMFYLEKGDFKSAERTFTEVLGFQDYLGVPANEKSATYNSLARLYQYHGLFDMALAEIDSAISGCLYGCETLLQNKAAIYLTMGQTANALNILEEIKQDYAFKSPRDELAFHLNFISSKRDHSLADASDSWRRASEIMNSDSAAIPVMLQASFYQMKGISELNLGNHAAALESFNNSYYLQQKFVGETSFKLREIQNYLAITHLLEGNLPTSVTLFENATRAEEEFIKYVYPVLTRAEQMSFLTGLRDDLHLIYSAILKKGANEQVLLATMLKRQMIYKGLTLNVKKLDKHAGKENPELNALRSEYYAARKQLAEGYVRMYLNNSVRSIVQLENQISSLERQITRLSGNHQREFTNISEVTDLASHLRAGEVLIEMIRLEKIAWDATQEDELNYLALMVFPDGHLELVAFEDGQFMEDRQLKYYLNSVRFDLPDSLSFGELWQPLMKNMKEVNHAYVVLDGLYHKLNPATLWIPSEEKFLGEKLRLSILQNSNELIHRDALTGVYSASHSASLVGNPVLERKGQFAELPETKIEIDNIHRILAGKGWAVTRYTDKNATKAAVNEVRDQGIIHFATHGYFSDRQMIGREKLPDIELFRSGLVLTAENSGEGDLFSAFEVSDMNLAGTELVVLSACETGLGDLQNGDGVYGLQYGFFLAGAKTVLLSLWQVDDQVTREYMEIFYTNLLQTSNKHQAYEAAVKHIRDKYPSPRFWGAFIYLGD